MLKSEQTLFVNVCTLFVFKKQAQNSAKKWFVGKKKENSEEDY